jgi:hypothetical protein
MSNSRQIKRSAFGLVTPDEDRQMYNSPRCPCGEAVRSAEQARNQLDLSAQTPVAACADQPTPSCASGCGGSGGARARLVTTGVGAARSGVAAAAAPY